MKVGVKDLRVRLEESRNFDEVFTVVKRAVERTFGLHRAGLTLMLAELPNVVGAYHVLGSNLIVVNRSILNLVSRLSRSRVELNSFLFTILAHEYLHSLGYLREAEVRPMVHRLCVENFGEDHPSVSMASKNLVEIYPQLRELGRGRVGKDFEVVKEFDRSSMPYIG